MAVVEEYTADSDDEGSVLPEPLRAESCSSSQDAPAKHQDTIDANIKGLSIHELLENLRVPHEFQKAELVAQLPDEQIHATRCRILSALKEIANRFNKDSSDYQSPDGHHMSQKEGLDNKAYAAITRLRAMPSVPDDALIIPDMTSVVNGKNGVSTYVLISALIVSRIDILTSIKQPTNIAHDILVDLKSIFSSNPHPEVSLDSGRRLIRPIGGDAGRSDMFEDQHWKAEWGVWNSLRWCVEVIPLFQLLRFLYPDGQGKEEEVAKNVEQAVERGIINGWAYSKSGKEGVESMTFIPSLLNPLIIPPAPYIIPLQLANLQALHTLLATIETTGRAARWRGEILNGVGRLMIALSERGVTASETDQRRLVNSDGLKSLGSQGESKKWIDVDGEERQGKSCLV
ncbi:hypothetical protein QFC19_006184 [Naganishia cerealis]|uniref:Uncharacterized protein n=1 Tax=Naganishia cerealis TaxID=610337 RepID=A0ACC2VIN8_9TREE|nr:hypothetical protein QFC19_006184 [Naganishia cerealis]